MNKNPKNISLIYLVVLFIGLPLLLYATGDFPRRGYLKESLSILTIVSFVLMFTQFFLVRNANYLVEGSSFINRLQLHKIIGYAFTLVLGIHPFLIVLPRYFEAGIGGNEAFLTIITSFDNTGIILGIISWVLMLVLTVTSVFRYRFSCSYKKWRIFHGSIAVLFVGTACFHALDLGRHIDLLLGSYIGAFLVISVGLWLKSILYKFTGVGGVK